jgi:hypothetical protein
MADAVHAASSTLASRTFLALAALLALLAAAAPGASAHVCADYDPEGGRQMPSADTSDGVVVRAGFYGPEPGSPSFGIGWGTWEAGYSPSA